MLGQDEHEKDTKNWTSTNSASELTNPLEMVKKRVRIWNSSILMSEIGVMSKLRYLAKINMKHTRKIGLQRIQLLPHEPLRNGKKTSQALESLNSDV